MFRLIESRFEERTPRQRFEMLHERGGIEIINSYEDAESVTYEFRKIPEPVVSGWVYVASFAGDYAEGAARVRTDSIKTDGQYQTLTRSYFRPDPDAVLEEWDVFSSPRLGAVNASM